MEEGGKNVMLAHDGTHDVSMTGLECVTSSGMSCQKTAMVAMCGGEKCIWKDQGGGKQ